MTVSQAIDYERWLLAEYLEPWQCVALTLGINPLDGLLPGYQSSIKDLYDEARLSKGARSEVQRRASPLPEFVAIVEELERALDRQELSARYLSWPGDSLLTDHLMRVIAPLEYVAWAKDQDISLPTPMDEAASALMDVHRQLEAQRTIDIAELKLTFHYNGLFKAEVGQKSSWLHPLQLGLINPQSNKPNQCFTMLSAFFAEIRVDNPTKQKRTIAALRKRLKESLSALFQIEGNPIIFSKNGYRLAFTFHDFRNAEQRRQMETMNWKETSYDDERLYEGLHEPLDGYTYYETKAMRDDPAAEFLKEHMNN